MDRRDVLIDQLSGYGQVSVENLASGSTNVSFVDRDTGITYPIVADKTADWAGPPAGDWNPGGEIGGLLTVGKTPGGMVDGYLAQIDSFTKTLADTVNSVYGGSFFSYGSPEGSTITVSAAIQAAPAQHPLRHRRHRLQRPRARGLAAARQRRRSTASTRRSSPRSAATSTRPPACRATRRCSPTRSRTAARACRASRWTRRCPTWCASSARTRRPPAPCPRWTRCWTSSSTGPERLACNAHHDLDGPAQRPLGPQHRSPRSSPRRSPRRPRARRSRARATIRTTPRARWACARRSAANEQYKSNISDAQGWQDATESALGSITDFVNRAQSLLLQGANDTADAGARNSVADEIDQIIQGIKETANASYGDRYLMSGTATSTAPYKLGDDDAYQGDEAGLDPTIPGVVREIGPGVTMSINSVGARDPRRRPRQPDRRQAAQRAARHLRAPARQRRRGAARRRHRPTLKGQLDGVLQVRSRNGAMTNRLEAASTRLEQIQGAVTEQLSNTEDADIAKTIIEFNSQSAAYQASLRAGANIVQSSLMDFLR